MQVEALPITREQTGGKPARIHLPFLDGLRGFAALYVVLSHLVVDIRDPSSPLLHYLTTWMRYGHYAVAVFIVLSGYCLMLPVVRAGAGSLPGGFAGYIKRRARRILPPYYAAILVTLAFHGYRTLRMTGADREASWRWITTEFSAGSTASHLFAVHNVNKVWNNAINGTFWSIATEWEIYFLFPFILLPVLRRYGLPVMLAVGFGLGLAPHLMLGTSSNLDWAAPWFVGLFAMGAAGAVITSSPTMRFESIRERLPWGALAGVFAISVPVMLSFWPAPSVYTKILIDVLTGAATTSFIIYAASYAASETADAVPRNRMLLLRILESRYAVLLGAFSYSLYLIHAVALLPLRNRFLTAPPSVALPVLLVVGVPLSLAAGYLFYLAVERRFTQTSRRSGDSANSR